MTKKKQEFKIVDEILDKTTSKEIIKKYIVIEEKFKNLIPPLSQEEYAQLEANIIAEGCKEAIQLWQRGEKDYPIIDGHNRFNICKEHNLSFNIEIRNFQDEEEAMDWMINHQLGRRNTTAETQAYLRGLQYNRLKNRHGGDRKSSMQKEYLKTSEQLAQAFKVNKSTIQRNEQFALGLDKLSENNPEIRNKILAKIVDINMNSIMKLAKEQDENVLQQMRDFINNNQEAAPKERKKYTNRDLSSIKKELFKIVDRAIDEDNKKLLKEANKYIDKIADMLSD